MRNKPLISVIMPAYNAEKYIYQAIESILNQTFKNFEFIIIDDASTDNTWNIIKSYKNKDKRIIILRNKINSKLSVSLNKCILKARGIYIARMDADDWSYPYRLLCQYRYMEKNPDVGLSGGTMDICDKDLNMVGKRNYHLNDLSIRRRIFLYSPFSHPLMIFRTKVLIESGLYNHMYNPAEDYELYFRMGEISKFGNIPQSLIKYRVISNSMTLGSMREMELKTLSTRIKFSKTKLYQMNLIDRIYFFLELISIYLIPNKIRLWFFSLLRNSSLLGKSSRN